MQAIERAIAKIDVQEIKDKRIAQLDREISLIDDELSLIMASIRRIEARLKQTDRPRIGSVLKKAKQSERRELVSSLFRKATEAAAQSADTVIKALEVGMKMAGAI